MSSRTAGLSLIALLAGSFGSTVAAQSLALDVSAGQIVYEPVSAETATSNAAVTLRYESPRAPWLYGTMAMPFGGNDSRWGGGGIGSRFVRSVASRNRVNVGADLGAHGFAFRDAVAGQGGNGGFVEALPFVSPRLKRARVGGARHSPMPAWSIPVTFSSPRLTPRTAVPG